MKKFFLSTSVFISMIITLSCSAQNDRRDGPPNPQTLLKELDANDDNKLSKSEVKGPLKNDFDKIDTDEDGYLSLSELKKAPKPKGNRPPENRGLKD